MWLDHYACQPTPAASTLLSNACIHISAIVCQLSPILSPSFEARMLRKHAAWSNRTPRTTRWVAYSIAFAVPAALLWYTGDGSYSLMNHKVRNVA